MPKFKVIKEGANEALIQKVDEQVASYIKELFHEHEIVKLDNTYSFSFGTVTVNIRVIGFHSEDVLVEVYSYLAQNIALKPEVAIELLRLNATQHFGSFGVTFDNTVTFSYSLAGANLDLNEFIAAVQTVASVSDAYDEMILAEGPSVM
jgi:Putative bacterial sensory transduction regulator